MVLMCSNEKLDNLPFAKPTGNVQKAEAVVKVDGVLVVRLANGRFMTSARDFHKWAYPISSEVTLRGPVIRGLQKIGFITKAEADEHMAQNKAAVERKNSAWRAKSILENADRLGIKMTAVQTRKLGELVK